MTVQTVSATGSHGGNTQYTISSTAPLKTSSLCTAHVNSAMGSPNTEMTPVLSIDSGTMLTLNLLVGSGGSGGFIACTPLAAPQNFVENQGVAATNYGHKTTITGVTPLTSPYGPNNVVELNFASASGNAGPFTTGQWVTVSGSPGPGVNGLHPITVVDLNDIALADLPFVSNATYGSNLAIQWLDPVVGIGCSGQTARAAPGSVAGLTTWGIYCDATSANTLSAIRNDGATASIPLTGSFNPITSNATVSLLPGAPLNNYLFGPWTTSQNVKLGANGAYPGMVWQIDNVTGQNAVIKNDYYSTNPTIATLATGSWGSFVFNASSTLASGGTGYAVNDTITMNNGAVVTVAAVSSGAVTSYTVTTTPTSSVTNPATQSSTSGSGTGATINFFYGYYPLAGGTIP